MIYGPGVQNYDISLDKNFAMPYNEPHRLQIRFDAFNAFNHTDFANPGVAGTKYIDQGGFRPNHRYERGASPRGNCS